MAVEALSQAAITDAMQALDGWGVDGDSITKTYEFSSYLAGVAFASAVGTIGEAQSHHPDMLVTWRKVKVTFTTHDAGSKITQKDIDAATAIEALGYPKK